MRWVRSREVLGLRLILTKRRLRWELLLFEWVLGKRLRPARG